MFELHCGSWSASVYPECGANLARLSYEGTEILRSPADIETLRSAPVLHGLPFLLPANRVSGATFSFHGETYTLPMNEPARNNHLHGLINAAPFIVVDRGQTHITMSLHNDGAYYPFEFDLMITDRLTQDGLERSMRLYNWGNKPMPYTLAIHAAFNLPTRVSVPVKARYAVDDNMIPTGEMLPLTKREQAYPYGVTLEERLAGFFTSSGNTVKIDDFVMDVSEQFDHWVLFHMPDRGFLCIEPQCGAVNGLNNGICRVLQPGAEEIFTFSIKKI